MAHGYTNLDLSGFGETLPELNVAKFTGPAASLAGKAFANAGRALVASPVAAPAPSPAP